jgi:hypothetical protein
VPFRAFARVVRPGVSAEDGAKLIQQIPLSRLQRATGLSLRYVSLIRRGERTPHPRHWPAFQTLVEARANAR